MSGIENNYRDFGHCPMCGKDTHVIGVNSKLIAQHDTIIDMPISVIVKTIQCEGCRSTWIEEVPDR